MIRIERKETVATVLLFFSLISSGIAIALAHDEQVQSALAFPDELQFFFGVCGVCSALLYFFERPIIIIPAHLIHLAALIVAVRILGAKFVIPELIICIPFALETAIYLEFGPGMALNGLLLIIMTASDVTSSANVVNDDNIAHITISTIVMLTISVLASTLTRYREIIVKEHDKILALRESVLHLSEANRAFQIYADHVESQSATDERNRITRELHDTVGYALTNVTMSMNAGMVLAKTDPIQLDSLFKTTKQQAESALQETRQTLYRLRAVKDTDPIGLIAISRLTTAFEAASDIAVEVNYGNAPNTFGPRIDEVIYRMVQEGLTNAFRHGRASRVKVSLWLIEQEIQIIVWDNGQGSDQVDEGIGLRGMEERVSDLGGALRAQNVSDGFKLTATIPYRKYRIDE